MNKGKAHDALNKFAGRWNTEGRIPAAGRGTGIKISGTDVYEWLLGEYFLLHKVDVLIGDDRNQATEIIGYDAVKDIYTMQHYDNKGNSGFMTATYINDTWTFSGETLRFTGGFKNNDTEFSGIWEQSSDGKDWTHFMDIRLMKDSK